MGLGVYNLKPSHPTPQFYFIFSVAGGERLLVLPGAACKGQEFHCPVRATAHLPDNPHLDDVQFLLFLVQFKLVQIFFLFSFR